MNITGVQVRNSETKTSLNISIHMYAFSFTDWPGGIADSLHWKFYFQNESCGRDVRWIILVSIKVNGDALTFAHRVIHRIGWF